MPKRIGKSFRYRSHRIASFVAVATMVFGMAGTATAQITGFGGSAMTGWTPNNNVSTNPASAGLPSVTGSGTLADTLTLTTANNGIASSYWFNAPQTITNFKESFTYTGASGADGVAVVWQNQGVTALGAGGGSLGFAGITSAAAFTMDLFNIGSASAFMNTTTSGSNMTLVPTMGGVDITSGHPINVTLSYSQSQGALAETMTDTVSNATYTRVWRGISIQGQVGGTTATVGFTGGTGGISANQSVTNFQFSPGAAAIPVPAITPIAATGYNQNMIISLASGSANITATIDGGTAKTGNTFYEMGVNPNTPMAGVPNAGVVFGSNTDANHTFVFQPNGAGQNDAVMLDQVNTTGALALTTPKTYSLLSFLVAGGNGGAPIGFTVHYAGGGTQSTTMAIPDWFGNGPIAWDANGRVSLNADGSINTSDFNNTNNNNPRMYQLDLPLTDTVDAVQSVSFTWQGTAGNGDEDVVFGISGAAVPEPSSMALLSVGAIGLLVRRRRAARAS
jgi:hypothetical protein